MIYNLLLLMVETSICFDSSNNTVGITKTNKRGSSNEFVRRPSYQFLYNSWSLSQRLRRNSNCDTLFRSGTTKDGVQVLHVSGNDVMVYCDFYNNGHNYVVIQRRNGGGLDFDQDYKLYQNGFGTLTGEFWLGLNLIHHLSFHLHQPVLRIDLTDGAGSAFAEYRYFRVMSSDRRYELRIGKYSGNAGDSTTGNMVCEGDGMCYHNYAPFSTRNHDNDNERWGRNCAKLHGGGWWFNDCFAVHLNGRYAPTRADNMDAITWYYWRQNFNPLTGTVMSLRNGD